MTIEWMWGFVLIGGPALLLAILIGVWSRNRANPVDTERAERGAKSLREDIEQSQHD